MTNIEKIKSMTCIQLANFLQNECACSHCIHGVVEMDEFNDYRFDCGIEEIGLDCLNGCYEWLNLEINTK